MKIVAKEVSSRSADLANLKPVAVRSDRRKLALGCPFVALREELTPNRFHFVLNRFPIPRLDSNTWKLRVSGNIESPGEFSYGDFLRWPSKTISVALECAGNGRALLEPPAEFIDCPWTHHSVSNARWTGVPLAYVLNIVGVKPSAKEVVFKGADRGIEAELGRTVSYGRSLILSKALDPDTLLAFEMNGEPLPRKHGFPLRLIVPGWYGMASVKWLTEVKILGRAFRGFYQRNRYGYEWTDQPEQATAVTTMKVKSLITDPLDGDTLKTGDTIIRGIAWAGGSRVKKVEISTDGGISWHKGRFVGRSGRYAWRQWEYPWTVREKGVYVLMAKATDEWGNTQPFRARWNRQGLGNNSIHTCVVRIRQ